MEGAASSPATADRAEERLTTGDFDYTLDECSIAQRPLPIRDSSRLLVVRRPAGPLEDTTFASLPGLMSPGDVLVVNDTRVFPARLIGRKPTGAAAEVLLVRPLDSSACVWHALVRPGGKLKPGRSVKVTDELVVEIEDSLEGGGRVVRLVTPLPVREALSRFGHVPLPPYIRREDDADDVARYQTVYGRQTGSVAAPTAGLHFSERTLRAIESRGVEIAMVTLHIGPGTFRPVEVDDLSQHRLEPEFYRVAPAAAAAINRAQRAGGAVWAVGTTVVRTLETVSDPDGRVTPGEGWSRLFVRPGFRFRAIDHLITNFHLPRSTLLMLVSAFGGHDLIMSAYRHAVRRGYRFYSYGDATVIL